MNRASSYSPYHAHSLNRLSLVPEQPTPLATPAMEKELQLQHISETEDILTGRTNSNASRRQSMMSTTNSYRQDDFQSSRTNSIRLDSMTRLDSTTRLSSMTSENSDAFMPPPVRRRSLMTPGVATRVEGPKYPLPPQRLQKEPPVTRRMSVQPPVSVSNPGFFTKIRRSQTLPSEAESPDYYNSDEMLKESPSELLERLRPLEKPTFRRSLEMKRVNTPNDLGHIGGYKLGSLRITNGEASPSQTPHSTETERDIDYFHMQRAAMGATQHTVSDPTVRTMQAISTNEPAELSAVSPGRTPRPHSKGHSFSFEQARSPLVDRYDDSKILELRPPALNTADLAESYRLELDFTSPFMEHESFIQSPVDAGMENNLPELTQQSGDMLTSANGRRQGDELYLPQSMRIGLPQNVQEHKQLRNVSGQQNNASGGLLKTDSGYSSHASLKSLGNDGSGSASRNPARPSVPEKTPPVLPRKESYVAYSAKSIMSMESDRTPTGAMSPLPTEPEAPQTPTKEKTSKADFWKTQHAPKTPKPISKVEDLTRKPVAETTHSSPVRVAPQTPQHEKQLNDLDATPKASVARPPIPKSFTVEPQNVRSIKDVGADREPIKVVRYTSVKEGPKPSLTDVPERKSTYKVLQKATGRPPMAVRTRSHSNAAAGELTRHKRSDSSDSLQSLRNMMSGGSRRNSRSNSIDRGTSGPPAVQKVTEIEAGYGLPAIPKNLSTTLKHRANRFSIGHAKNLWSENEEQKKEKETEKREKEAEKAEAKENKTAEKEKAKEDKVKEKAEKKDNKSAPPPAEEIEKSIRRKSSPALTPSERALAMLSMGPDSAPKSCGQTTDAKSDVSVSSNGSIKKSDKQIRKEFEQEITSFENVAGALGASPYDLAMKATAGQNSGSSSDSSLSTIKPNKGKSIWGPQRDQSGRIVGMDEASASQFARNRSQIRAMEQERREALMALHDTTQAVDDYQQQKTFAPQIGNSSFAKQLAAQAGHTIGHKKAKPTSIGAAADAPPMPAFNVEDLKHKRLSHSKSKKVTITGSGGPPVSALNVIRKGNSGKGRHNVSMFGRQRELSTQIEMPERFAPQPPTDSSASSVSGSESSITTPMSQPESATSVSSTGSEKAGANQFKPNMMISLFPNTTPAIGTSGIDGILDAVLAPMTPSPARESFATTLTPTTPTFDLPPQPQTKPNIFGTRAPPPVSPTTASYSLPSHAQLKPNIFGTRAPPPVSPATSTFSSGTTYLTPTSHLSPTSPTFPPAVASSGSPLASPTRPRLQSAMSSRSSQGSSSSSFHTSNGSGEKKRVAISTAPATVMTPSMAPRWQGPSPTELAEMAMSAKAGAMGKGKEPMRSHSAQSSYDAREKTEQERGNSAQGVRPRNEKRRSFGMGLIGGSKLKSSVEA